MQNQNSISSVNNQIMLKSNRKIKNLKNNLPIARND